MLRTIVNVEYDRYLRIEAGDAERRVIWLSFKHQPVSADGHRPVDEKERFHAPISVSPRVAQLCPGLVSILFFEADGDATRRRSRGRIEYVG